MIRDFAAWNKSFGEVTSLNELRGCRVAIEAAEFLRQRILNNHAPEDRSEPLVPALGGIPLGFTSRIEQDLQRFAEAGIEPFFIFSGLDVPTPVDPFFKRQKGEAINAAAWALYDHHKAEESVAKFGESTYVQPEDLFGAFQRVLVEKDVKFTAAPYSAWAQLAYLEQKTVDDNRKVVHAIAGASELLLFACEKFITSWDFAHNQFRWIKRASCINDLRKHASAAPVSEEAFVDACLLAGSHFLPPLPHLENEPRKQLPKPRAAMDMIVSARGSAYNVVQSLMDEPKMKETQYLDRYLKARFAVKHQPILTLEGTVEPMSKEKLPNDPVEFLGPRFPQELCHYMSAGLISQRVLNWRASSEIIETQPIDGGDSDEYKALVSQKLTPLRATAMNLLFSFQHRWFCIGPLKLKCWFIDTRDENEPHERYEATVKVPSAEEGGKSVVELWNVKDASIKDIRSQYEGCGSLGAAILALRGEDFIGKSSLKKDPKQPLSTTDEIIFNTIWRFLALREYVDQNHNLTAWGKVLATVIAKLEGKPELEEAAVVAVELLRLGMLHEKAEMFPNYLGAPMRGGSKDREFNLLISRVAGLGTLQHKPIGFTGPLSQHLLGYNSVINAVRTTDRDFVEACAVHIFGGGYAKRDGLDLRRIAVKLPFLLPNNCALSIAVKTYLDELFSEDEPASPKTKSDVLHKLSKQYFPQSLNFKEDLQAAFQLWDAVYEGVATSGNLVKDKTFWSEANAWLKDYR